MYTIQTRPRWDSLTIQPPVALPIPPTRTNIRYSCAFQKSAQVKVQHSTQYMWHGMEYLLTCHRSARLHF